MSAFEDVVEAWGFKIAGDKPVVLSPAGIAPDGSIVYSDAESFRDLIGAEPELGSPSVNGWILSSSSAGVRSWVAPNAHSHVIADVTGLQTALDGRSLTSHNHNSLYLGISAAAAAATKLATARTLTIGSTGKSFDGSTNVSWSLAEIGAQAAGSYAAAAHAHAISDVTGLQSALDGKESILGNPSISGYVLASTTAGVRSWVSLPTIPVTSVFGRTGAIVAASGDYTTAQVAESGNLYYTDARVRACVLTGYTAGSNTALAATDTILAAMGKIQRQINARLTGNQTITLSGVVTGSGATAITTSIADGALSIAKTSGLQAALDSKQDALGYVPVNKAGDAMTGGLTLPTLSTTGLATLQSLNISSQTGTTVRPAIFNTDGTVLRDGNGTLIQRPTAGGYVGVRNPSRLAGEFYEFWDSSAGWADIRCGTVKLNSLAASTIPVIDANKKLASQDYATFRTTIGAAAAADLASYALSSAIPVASSTTPSALGTAAVGTGTTWARADHVHAMPTAAQVGAAASAHTHAIADVTGLQTALDARSLTSHNHTLDSLSNTTITSIATGEILKWNGTAWINNTLAEAGIQPAGSYLTGNQTITLSGIVTGSGTTAITTSIADGALSIAKTSGLQGALDARMATASYPDLVAIEALDGTSGLLRKTAANTWSLDSSDYLTAPNVKEIYNWYSARPTDCNLAPNGNGGIRSFKATGVMTANKPPQGDSHIIHLGWDNTSGWESQIASRAGAGQLQVRGQSNGTWGAWRTVWDAANLTNLSQLANGPGYITASGNAATATAWQTARTLTIGNTGKSVNGTANVSWSLAEIGAQAAGSYAAAAHVHAISDVTGLQPALDGKISTVVAGKGDNNAVYGPSETSLFSGTIPAQSAVPSNEKILRFKWNLNASPASGSHVYNRLKLNGVTIFAHQFLFGSSSLTGMFDITVVPMSSTEAYVTASVVFASGATLIAISYYSGLSFHTSQSLELTSQGGNSLSWSSFLWLRGYAE